MAIDSRVICKVCGKGEIVSIIEYHRVWEPITWREHFFGKTSCFEALMVDNRSWFQRLFKRLERPRNTYTTTRNHCNVCGVRYEFIPSQNLKIPEARAGMVQINPNLWTVQKSNSIVYLFAK